jgi:hypothetical protein
MTTKSLVLKTALALTVIASLFFLLTKTFQIYESCTAGFSGCEGFIGLEPVGWALPFIVVSIFLSIWYMRTQKSFRYWKLVLIVMFWAVAMYISMELLDSIVMSRIEDTRLF